MSSCRSASLVNNRDNFTFFFSAKHWFTIYEMDVKGPASAGFINQK
jgi:hypothetical protein